MVRVGTTFSSSLQKGESGKFGGIISGPKKCGETVCERNFYHWLKRPEKICDGGQLKIPLRFQYNKTGFWTRQGSKLCSKLDWIVPPY